MYAILNFITFILFFVFIVACITGWFIYRSVRDVADRLRGKNRNAGYGSQRRNTYHSATDEEVIIDHRSPDEVNRKIFSEGEGEYVDFEEEK